ncbi:MAG: GxxExxY protein [Limisphaerales bacterium]
MADAIAEAAEWVNQHRGMGWRETHLENALAAQLRVQGMLVVQQPTVAATIPLSNGIEMQVGSLRPDLLVRTSADGVEIEQFYVEIKLSQSPRANVSQAHLHQAQGYASQTGVPCIAVFFCNDRTVGTHIAIRPPTDAIMAESN